MSNVEEFEASLKAHRIEFIRITEILQTIKKECDKDDRLQNDRFQDEVNTIHSGIQETLKHMDMLIRKSQIDSNKEDKFSKLIKSVVSTF